MGNNNEETDVIENKENTAEAVEEDTTKDTIKDIANDHTEENVDETADSDDNSVNKEIGKEIGEETKKEINGNYVEFDVSMNKNVLYDFMINHAYQGSAGIIGTCFGALGIIMFLYSGCQQFIYLAFGLILIFYLPINLKLQCSKQMTLNPVYKKPIHYLLDADGITVSQGESMQTVGWDKCTKAVSTKQSIAVYTGKNNASIFPRKQLGEELPAMLAILSEYMEPKKIKIRY